MTKITHAPERQSASMAWPRGLANLSPALLVEHAIRSGNGILSAQGALVANTAPRTGRSVKDKFIVRDQLTAERVAWGGFNTPIDPDIAGRLQKRIGDYLRDRQPFTGHAWSGANAAYLLA